MTVLVVAAMAVISMAGGVMVCSGEAMVLRHRAAAAADAAALSAALAAEGTRQAPCPAAAAMARRDDATLIRCAVAGPDATVEVAVAASGVIAWLGKATETARAGPAGLPS